MAITPPGSNHSARKIGIPPHGRCRVLVSEGNLNRAGVFHQLSVRVDAAHFVDGFGDWDGAGGVVFVAHHGSEFSFFEQLNGFDAEAGA